MRNSAVILAGGFSRRFGQYKALVDLAGKPLILHVFERVSNVVDETVVVVSSDIQREKIESLLERRATNVVDKYDAQGPLVGALTGFEHSRGLCSLLLPCDAPFISTQIAEFLLGMCANRSAVIPRWPNGYIEPLHAAYNTQLGLTAAKMALEQRKLDLQSMITLLRTIRYVSTVVLKQMDTRLLSFFNINTSEDLKRAESLLK